MSEYKEIPKEARDFRMGSQSVRPPQGESLGGFNRPDRAEFVGRPGFSFKDGHAQLGTNDRVDAAFGSARDLMRGVYTAIGVDDESITKNLGGLETRDPDAKLHFIETATDAYAARTLPTKLFERQYVPEDLSRYSKKDKA